MTDVPDMADGQGGDFLTDTITTKAISFIDEQKGRLAERTQASGDEVAVFDHSGGCAAKIGRLGEPSLPGGFVWR